MSTAAFITGLFIVIVIAILVITAQDHNEPTP